MVGFSMSPRRSQSSHGLVQSNQFYDLMCIAVCCIAEAIVCVQSRFNYNMFIIVQIAHFNYIIFKLMLLRGNEVF